MYISLDTLHKPHTSNNNHTHEHDILISTAASIQKVTQQKLRRNQNSSTLITLSKLYTFACPWVHDLE